MQSEDGVSSAPRIYNLFPTLAGPMAAWPAHFDRIAAMGFTWVYVNPIHATGGSGSLYAVADYRTLNPALRGADTRPDDEVVHDMVEAAAARGLAVMLDLVINHTANDSPLVGDHPEWYARDATGAIVAPSAVDPDDPARVTTWGDLAELDYAERPILAEMIGYFADVVRHYVALGVRGFRCDAAYKVPGDVWRELIVAARADVPDVLFAAETLGCTVEETARLASAGFDYLFNSSKWWDFRAGWLLDQYETFRHVAPSIAFPESHDTPRLVTELDGRSPAAIEAEYRFRYLFAAFFSSGVMMPMGYEFGFARKLDVVRTRPDDWETPRFDLTAFVADVNAMKAAMPVLNEEGAERVLDARKGDALGLVRLGASRAGAAVAVLNASTDATAAFDAARIIAALDGAPLDVTPHALAKHPLGPDERLDLAPLEMRVFTRTVSTPTPHAGNGKTRDPRLDARAAVIERVEPSLDGGRHAIKRIVGERVDVGADVFRDGHDAVSAVLLYRTTGGGWTETTFAHVENDRFAGSFTVDRAGTYEYAIEAWPDAFATWHHDVERKREAGQALGVEIVEGLDLVRAAADRARGSARTVLETVIRDVEARATDDGRLDALLGSDLESLMRANPDRAAATRSPSYRIDVDRRAAQFSAWYELFPRSQGARPGVHGTFDDAARRLGDIRAMGFDVVYLPPIHPIGRSFRKGKNNSLDPLPSDPGSPWAIGNDRGGHTAVEPALGTLDDFDRFVAAARTNGLEVALDYALQCSPDHPWVTEHPEWFTVRPDGTIKYAENPPKKYQDIVNFKWFGPHAPQLWDALRDIVLFWIGHGVRIFRVDNPHTKPFAFWEWMIADVRARYPETLFLAEAFTRPKVMGELAKIGFSQSYTYFTWRTTKAELTTYATELARTELADFYRPSFWPNTPDILPPYLQTGGRPAFLVRLVLAATLASVYGIYSGYELCENAGLPGREEYADSEKYEIRVRDWNAPGNIKAEIARINRIRRDHPALRDWRNLTFYRADDDAVIFYGKRAGDDVLLMAVNLDPFAARDALLWFPTGDLGIGDGEAYDVEELLGETSHVWRDSPHRWRLDPQVNPAAVFHIRVPRRAAGSLSEDAS
jgi:starch synthase (maltosyl-transferring)